MNVEQMIIRIDELAKKNNISRNKLLQACGVKSLVDNLNKGQIPRLDTILKIADYLNISIDYLLCRTDKPKINK